jgi:primosomal protein N' (replication factor Y)|tara:strand:+ start:2519 stop:4966 length:2448 start_codon:yes stop_codon:yes gene_type:complete
MNYYIDVIVPLPLDNIFTYKVNLKEFEFIKIGFRVIVPFGKSKFITALVANKHNKNPEFYIPKEIEFIIDEEPSMNKNQLIFFKWISKYYMCPLGQVLKVGLPKLLLLKSESEIVLIDENIENLKLTQSADFVFKNLLLNKKITYREIISILNKKNISKTINELSDYGLIKLKEEIYDYFKPKSIVRILFNEYPNDSLKKLKLLKSLEGKKSQQKVVKSLFFFSKTNYPSIKELIKKTGVSRGTINSLIESNILAKKVELVSRVQFDFSEKDKIKELSEDQNRAFKEIVSSFNIKNVTLLHGVTSSGKTEIYVKLIYDFLKQNKQILYLVPEIALTTQLISRLKKYFGDSLAVYHSKYSQEQRTEVWKKVIKNNKKARVVIGARSSIFLPFNNLGLIIVDEEHENAYKQFNPSPRYHARDSAIYLASVHNAKILLGSATPSLESYFNAITKKYSLVKLEKRYGNVSLPKIIINDLKESIVKKSINGNFSFELLNNIKNSFENNEQVILFQNRRGHSPYLECNSCGFVYQCINCDVSLTYHQTTNKLKCHHCGFSEENDTKCKKCFKSTILKRGLGTQQVEEEVKNIFPEITVKRMDHDSTRKKNSFQEIISGFENNDFELLVGTQMLTKGLDFKNVALVGVLNADSLIYFPDFRSQEKCFQLLQQVAGRAGRVKKQGKVVIQTYNPKHDLMNKIVKNDYVGMFNEQLNQRFTFEYPPYSRLIKIILKNKDLNKLIKASDWLSQALRNEFKKELLGPESPLIARINNKHIKNILIKIPVNKSLIKSKDFINKIINSFRSISFFKSVDIIIDVDPYN